MNQQRRHKFWKRSFFTTIIFPRYLLTPFGTVTRSYVPYTNTDIRLDYHDVYIFGIRIARLSK